jgi:hypothetical protein
MRIEDELRKALSDEVSHLDASPLLLDGVRNKRHRRILRNRMLVASVVTAVVVVVPVAFWNVSGPPAPTPLASPSPRVTVTYEPGPDFEELEELGDQVAPVSSGGSSLSGGPASSEYLLAVSCVGTAQVKFTINLLNSQRKNQVLQCPGETHFTYQPRLYTPNYTVEANLVGPGEAHVSWKFFGRKTTR